MYKNKDLVMWNIVVHYLYVDKLSICKFMNCILGLTIFILNSRNEDIILLVTLSNIIIKILKMYNNLIMKLCY